MRKFTIKKKYIHVDDMKTLDKIILIFATYAFLVEKKSLLNKKFTNHKGTNSRTCTTTSSLISNTSFSFV